MRAPMSRSFCPIDSVQKQGLSLAELTGASDFAGVLRGYIGVPVTSTTSLYRWSGEYASELHHILKS